MKLTTKKLYQLIEQVLLTEAAKGIQDIPENYHVVCEEINDGYQISLDPIRSGGSRSQIGFIQFVNIPTREKGNCLDGMMISMSFSDDGWGPFLYDLVMEKATIESGGIIPDRTVVSDQARGVWEYYLNNRTDIIIRQLDSLDDSFKNGPHDDCSQASSQKHLRWNWKKSPLSKIYSKKPTTIEALKSIKKWIEV